MATQREAIVWNGLDDLDDNVRAAVGRPIATWVDVALGGCGATSSFFELVEGRIAEDTLVREFIVRADIFDNIGSEDEYWESLTPERALIARVFVDHSHRRTAPGSRVLPAITALAFNIRLACDELLARI
ncbi:hypothetical protein EVJ58_g5235 [Rhodofomes roseus]|nr:hypothetical protein EVJ58_g5235 [Rhodofomes roseus]